MPDWPLAVLFDFDGVIVDSEPVHFIAFRQTLVHAGIQLTEQEYYREMIGFDDRGAFRRALALHGNNSTATLDELMALKPAVMRQLLARGEVKALPGAVELIRRLNGRVGLAICSGARREEIECMLDGIALRECFSVITAAEDVPVGKPDPSGYLLTMRSLSERLGLSLSPGDCLVIEDAPSVAASVRRAGFKVLGVTTTCDAAQFRVADFVSPSLVVESLRQAVPNWKILEKS